MVKIEVIVLCLTFINKASAIQTVLKYTTEDLTWFGAQRRCQESNGHLFIPTTTNIVKLNISCPVALSGNIWSGQYNILSKWIEFVGCYTELNRPKLQSNSLTTSDPLVCQHLCQNNTYFGFYKGNICICFGDDSYVLANKQEANAQECYIRCASRSDVFSGGNSAVSVYKTVTKTFPSRPGYDCTNENCNCVSAECTTIKNTTMQEFFRRPCTTDLVTVCSNNALTTGDAPQWTESLTQCSTQQNRYPITSDASDDICDKSSATWTSIFRDIFTVDDEIGKSPGSVHSCFQMDWTGNVPRKKQINCTRKMPFVCEIAITSEQSNDECLTTTLSRKVDSTVPTSQYLQSQSMEKTSIIVETKSPETQLSHRDILSGIISSTVGFVLPIIIIILAISLLVWRRKSRGKMTPGEKTLQNRKMNPDEKRIQLYREEQSNPKDPVDTANKTLSENNNHYDPFSEQNEMTRL